MFMPKMKKMNRVVLSTGGRTDGQTYIARSYQGWGQILLKGFKYKSFQIFQIQSKSFYFQKDLNPNPVSKRN